MLIFAILGHTPLWVWFLLAFLVYRGVAAMRPRDVSPSRGLIIPVVFFVWGGAGLFAATDSPVLNIALFLGVFLAGLAIGRALTSLSPAPRFSHATGLMTMPGSPVTLILVGLAFAAKYAGGVALALSPDIAARAEISSVMAASGGLFAGIFWGRTLGQFHRALQADGQPVTLANFANLVLAPAGKSAPSALS